MAASNLKTSSDKVCYGRDYDTTREGLVGSIRTIKGTYEFYSFVIPMNSGATTSQRYEHQLMLLSPFPGQYHPDGLKENHYVEEQGVVLYVVKIILQLLNRIID